MKKLCVISLLLLFIGQAYAGTKFATYNIRTFDSSAGRTNKFELRKILRSINADLVTVQEIVNIESFKNFVRKNLSEYSLVLSRCGGGGKQKIGFLYKRSRFNLKKVYEDNRLSDPNYAVGELGCGRLRPALVGLFKDRRSGREFVAVGVHLKAGGSTESYELRKKQYTILSRIVGELKLADREQIIIMGDFNTTGYVLKDSDYSKFNSMLRHIRMKSVSRELECTSYWAGEDREDGLEEPSILDHIVHPKYFLGYGKSKIRVNAHCYKQYCRTTSEDRLGTSYQEVSDHCPVTVEFK